MQIERTRHPEWIEDLLGFVEPYKNRVVRHPYFRDMANGTLSLRQFQGGLINFYPLIESFPQYLALNLAKIPAGGSKWNKKTRYWLIANIHVEQEHVGWWRQWAQGFGILPEVLEEEIHPPPEMDAINNYLWRVATHGSLTEGISATNFAVEGPTGEWTRIVQAGLYQYQTVSGVTINEKTLQWILEHARYDDQHPYQALEIIKAYATTREEQKRVEHAAQRAMEYYAMALDACYELFK